MSSRIKSVAAMLVAVSLSVSISACSPQGIVQAFEPSKCDSGPIVETISDTSGSTRRQRGRNGAYEAAEMTAAEDAAAGCGELFATTADGNAVSDAGWVINGTQFDQALGDRKLSEAARVHAARRLLPKVRRLLQLTPTAGTDLLGALQRVALASNALSHRSRKVEIFIESDGVLNVPGSGGYSLYRTPVDTPRRRSEFVARLEAAGELPDLNGASVVLQGIGVGVGDRLLARSVIALWADLVPAMNGRLMSIDAARSDI